MIIEPTSENIKLITQKFLQGEIIIFPTDTVFGIGCIATNNKAIEKIYKLKERDLSKSLLINVANFKTLKKIAIPDSRTRILINNFKKESISFILKYNYQIKLSPYVIKNNCIGVRIPKNKVLIKILQSIKIPIVSTSCNKSGNSHVINSEEAEKIFGKNILIIKETEKLSNIPSTIIDLSTSKTKYIREGSVKFSSIEIILNSNL